MPASILATLPHTERLKLLMKHHFYLASAVLFKWLHDKYMNYWLESISRNLRAAAKIDNTYIYSGEEKVLLSITIDSNLSFEKHMNNTCKKQDNSKIPLQELLPAWICRN